MEDYVDNQEINKGMEFAIRSLGCVDQTKEQLRRKLVNKQFSEETIRQVLHKLEEYHYIDDERYVEQFVLSHCTKLNRHQMENKLRQKGIVTEELQIYLDKYNYDEKIVFEKAAYKYSLTHDMQREQAKEKMIAYFMKKGYRYSTIREYIQNMQNIEN